MVGTADAARFGEWLPRVLLGEPECAVLSVHAEFYERVSVGGPWDGGVLGAVPFVGGDTDPLDGVGAAAVAGVGLALQ